MDDQALSRISELEAKLEILQVRFDKLRAVVQKEEFRIDMMIDYGTALEVAYKTRDSLNAALKI